MSTPLALLWALAPTLRTFKVPRSFSKDLTLPISVMPYTKTQANTN